MTTRLDGRIALITGASSGIGSATALCFSRLGAKLALTGRNQENLKVIAKQCLEASDQDEEPLVIVADLSSEEDTERVIAETIQHYKQLHILVNNAGILMNGSIENITLQQFDTQMNINLRSQLHLTSLATPHLVQTKGCIVFVSSVAGMRSFPNVLPYCVSKSAIDQLARCSALELASKQVRVNCVNPGVIMTDIHKRAGMDNKQYEEFLDRCKVTHALGRFGEANEVASVIAFLASDGASFITGVTIPVDGGRHAMCPR